MVLVFPEPLWIVPSRLAAGSCFESMEPEELGQGGTIRAVQPDQPVDEGLQDGKAILASHRGREVFTTVDAAVLEQLVEQAGDSGSH